LFVVLIASAGANAQLDQSQDQYVAPQPVTARGLAPNMKYKNLGQQVTTYAVIFGSGDEVASGLTE
jgi:hypothetical protein